jgi:hypothetical protein
MAPEDVLEASKPVAHALSAAYSHLALVLLGECQLIRSVRSDDESGFFQYLRELKKILAARESKLKLERDSTPNGLRYCQRGWKDERSQCGLQCLRSSF